MPYTLQCSTTCHISIVQQHSLSIYLLFQYLKLNRMLHGREREIEKKQILTIYLFITRLNRMLDDREEEFKKAMRNFDNSLFQS